MGAGGKKPLKDLSSFKSLFQMIFQKIILLFFFFFIPEELIKIYDFI